MSDVGQPGQMPPGQDPYGRPPAHGGYPAPPPYPYPWGPTRPEDRGAQVSLVVGIVSLVAGLMTGIGFIGSPFALVLGVRSKHRIDAAGGALAGRSSAQAGFILGLIGTVLLVLGVLLIIGLLTLFFTVGTGEHGFEVTHGTRV